MKVLLLLPQSPFEQAAGDARSMRTICEMLATQGFEVSALATTASYLPGSPLPREQMTPAGSDALVRHLSVRGIDYTLLNVGALAPGQWHKVYETQFEALFQDQLRKGYDILFTYGGSPSDIARRKLVRERGGKVLFGLRGLGYLEPGSLDHVDAFVPCSEFVARRYREALGLEMAVLPVPVWEQDVVAPSHQPEYLTFINPTHAKGVMLFARLAEMLCEYRPAIPIRVVESRGTGNDLLAAGFAGGFDLRLHPNLKVIPNTSRPASLYARTRVLVVPSLWDEPAGRVPVEAMLNGIPPIVSDRGGLPEVCRGGGFIVPVPGHVRPFPPSPVAAEDVRPWLDLVIKLWDDEAFYQQARDKAQAAAGYYQTPSVAQQYAELFRGIGKIS